MPRPSDPFDLEMHAKVVSVPCTKCGAKVGESCVRPNGTRVPPSAWQTAHGARRIQFDMMPERGVKWYRTHNDGIKGQRDVRGSIAPSRARRASGR